MHTNAYRKAIARVLAYIDCNRQSALDLDELAKIARVSKFHFHRVFKAYMGISLGHYVKLKGLETGMWKLIQTENNTLDIAMDSGYENHAAFSRAFKKEIGCSPQDFKKQFMKDQKLAMSTLHENPPAFVGFKELPTTKILFMRRQGSYHQAALSAWDDLLADLAHASIRLDHQIFYGISQDDPNAEGITRADIRFDVGVVMTDEIERVASKLSAMIGTIEGGKFAVFLHRGAMDRLPASYHFIYGRWIFDNKVRLRDERPFIKYKNPLAPKDQEQEAEIYLPVD